MYGLHTLSEKEKVERGRKEGEGEGGREGGKKEGKKEQIWDRTRMPTVTTFIQQS
jgi:hypothetical protein